MSILQNFYTDSTAADSTQDKLSRYHRGEAMYISLIDFQWTSTETKSFQLFNNSQFNYDYLHQLWKYICPISTKI